MTHRTPPLAAAAAAELAQKVWNRLASAEQAQDVPLTLTRQQYLDAIVPGTRAGPGGGGPGAVVWGADVVPMVACHCSRVVLRHSSRAVASRSSCAVPSSRPVCSRSPDRALCATLHPFPPTGSSAQPNYETATWAAGAMAAHDMGRPSVAAAAKSGARSSSVPPPEVDIPTDLQPAIISSTLKLLKTVPVRWGGGCCRLYPAAGWWRAAWCVAAMQHPRSCTACNLCTALASSQHCSCCLPAWLPCQLLHRRQTWAQSASPYARSPLLASIHAGACTTNAVLGFPTTLRRW